MHCITCGFKAVFSVFPFSTRVRGITNINLRAFPLTNTVRRRWHAVARAP